MGWTGEVHVQEGYPDASADNTVEASIVSLADGIIVAGGLDNDWYNLVLRAFRVDGEGGLEAGPVAGFNGYTDVEADPNINPINGDDPLSLAFDDMNKFVKVADYTFAYIGESSRTFDGVGGDPDVGGDYMVCAQFLTVDPETLEITRTGAAWADNNFFYADEATGAAWGGKLLLMTGSATGSGAPRYLALCDIEGDTEPTYLATPSSHERMGPIAVTGDLVLYYDDDDPAWYSIDMTDGTTATVTTDDFGQNYSWAWFPKTLQDGRIAVIVTSSTSDGTGDPVNLVVFDADLGGYSGPYPIAPTARNVGWTGGWYSNVRSIDEYPDGTLLIGYIEGNNIPWLVHVDPDDGTIITRTQPAHNINAAQAWNYEIATFKNNNSDFLLMWAGYDDAGDGTYRLLVAGGGESFGLPPVSPFREDFENGTDGERITTINTHFPGIDWDADPYANDADVFFTDDSHSGELAAVGAGYTLHYPYTYADEVVITGDPESGTFWMKVDYSMFTGQEALFSIHTGDVGDQITSANENLTLYRFDGESNLQWEDHTYDTPVMVPDDTWFKVEWSVEGPAYTIKITNGAGTTWLDVAKDMDDDGFDAPYYKFAHVTFYLTPGVTLDDVNVEECSPLAWWDGAEIQPAVDFGWGQNADPIEILGWWDGSDIQPLDCMSGAPVEPLEDMLLFSEDLDTDYWIMNYWNSGGVVSSEDLITGADSASPYDPLVMKLDEDGSVTYGASWPKPDPDSNGSTNVGFSVDENGDLCWFACATLDTAGHVVMYKYEIDPVTLVGSEQDTYEWVFVGSYSYTPHLNHFGRIVFDTEDYASGLTDHDFRILPFDSTGFSAPIVITDAFDTTGLTGFDAGFEMNLAESRYLTGHSRYFEVDPDGTVVMNMSNTTDISTIYDNNYFENYGCVENLFITGVSSRDSLGVLSAGGDVTTIPLTDFFGAGTWIGKNLWSRDGIVYLGATNADGTVGKVVKDLYGSATAHTFEDPGFGCIPSGTTSRGELFTLDLDNAAQHYAIHQFGDGTPVDGLTP